MVFVIGTGCHFLMAIIILSCYFPVVWLMSLALCNCFFILISSFPNHYHKRTNILLSLHSNMQLFCDRQGMWKSRACVLPEPWGKKHCTFIHSINAQYRQTLSGRPKSHNIFDCKSCLSCYFGNFSPYSAWECDLDPWGLIPFSPLYWWNQFYSNQFYFLFNQFPLFYFSGFIFFYQKLQCFWFYSCLIWR